MIRLAVALLVGGAVVSVDPHNGIAWAFGVAMAVGILAVNPQGKRAARRGRR